MNKAGWLAAVLAGGISMPVLAATEAVLDTDMVVSFLSCGPSAAFWEQRSTLIREQEPIDIVSEVYYQYAFEGEFLTLPTQSVMFGVCGNTHTPVLRNCGTASFIAFTLSAPLDKAKAELLELTGTDYTEELRIMESGATNQAHLVTGDTPDTAAIYCDSGGL